MAARSTDSQGALTAVIFPVCVENGTKSTEKMQYLFIVLIGPLGE